MKILNRIVTFVLALAIFPAIVTRFILRIVLSIAGDSSVYTILSSIMEDTVNSAMEITISLQEIIGYIDEGTFSFGGMDFSISSLPSEMLVTKNWAIASIVLLIVALIVALVIMGCALFAQAHKTVMALSAGGIITCFAAIGCFNKFAEPFTSGAVDIGKFLAQSLLGNEEGLISSLGSVFLSGSISVDILQLGNAVITMAIIFLAILLWTFAYYITLPSDAKPKKVLKNK